MKILIIRFSSIGDIVLTSPVPRLIKKSLPNSEIHFLTKKIYSDLYSHNIYLDKLYLLDNDLVSISKDLKKNNYDIIIDLHNNLRSNILRLILGVKSLVYNKNRFKRWLLVNLKIKITIPHIVDSYIKTLSPLKITNDNEGLDYFLSSKDNIELNRLPKTHKKGYVVLIVGAKYNTKVLPSYKLIELCDKINAPIVLLGGNSEYESSIRIENYFKQSNSKIEESKVRDLLNKKTIIFNMVGKLSINQSASVISRADIIYTHDTGMMHIATAFKKDIVSIWGSSHPELGFYPYQTEFKIHHNDKIKCRPCSKIGYNSCPIGHFKCMNDLTFE